MKVRYFELKYKDYFSLFKQTVHEYSSNSGIVFAFNHLSKFVVYMLQIHFQKIIGEIN